MQLGLEGGEVGISNLIQIEGTTAVCQQEERGLRCYSVVTHLAETSSTSIQTGPHIIQTIV